MSKQTARALFGDPQLVEGVVRNLQQQPQGPFQFNSTGRQTVYRTTTPTNVNRQQQQQQQAFTRTTTSSNSLQPQHQSVNFPTFLNAPTSLTNLASLSGISLLPVSNQQQQFSSNNTNKLVHPIATKQQRQRQVGSNVHQRQTATRTPIGAQNIIVGSTTPTNIASGHQGPIFDLSSIPSIQLLNQASLESINPWKMTANAPKIQSAKSQQQYKPQANKNNSHQTNNRSTKSHSNNAIDSPFNNDIQLIAVTESLPMLASNSISFELQQPTQSSNNFDDILSQPNLDSTFGDQLTNDFNFDMNNVSLTKLMAILNNPALTITPVAGVPIAANPVNSNELLTNFANIHQPVSSSNVLNGGHCQLFQGSSFMNEQIQHEFIRGDNSRGISNIGKNDDPQQRNRIPRSAANLQVVYGEQIETLRNQTSNEHKDSPRHTSNVKMPGELPKPPTNDPRRDLELSWLPNYSLTNGNNESPASLPWNMRDINYSSDPAMISTSVRNLMMEQPPSNSNKLPTVSVQLLKHIANQTKDNNCWSDNPPTNDKSIFEPECILGVAKFNVQQLGQGAVRVESSYTVRTTCKFEKISKAPLQTNKRRLFIPAYVDKLSTKRRKVTPELAEFNLHDIQIEASGERKVLLSEHHLMLESMMPSETDEHKRSIVSEPDDIFVNRSKRIMSKIDTELERRKRKRFEQISGGSAPKKSSSEDQNADTGSDLSDDEDVSQSSFIPIQLPLEEPLTKEKSDHLISVGLVSRDEKNKILIKQCEERIKIFSPLALETNDEAPESIRRFVDTILQTGGTDVQLRTETTIKRSDLPLIEGLNRNTSRVKMTYMSALDLEKRSKRTTLYKVKPQENSNVQSSKQQNDLINKVKSVTAAPAATKQPIGMETVRQNGNIRQVVSENHHVTQAAKRALISCREALKAPPSKNEYMKSLGLIAS